MLQNVLLETSEVATAAFPRTHIAPISHAQTVAFPHDQNALTSPATLGQIEHGSAQGFAATLPHGQHTSNATITSASAASYAQAPPHTFAGFYNQIPPPAVAWVGPPPMQPPQMLVGAPSNPPSGQMSSSQSEYGAGAYQIGQYSAPR